MVPSSSLYEGFSPSSSLLLREKRVERNYSIRISIVMYENIAEEVYNSAQTIISNANLKYGLDVKHIQAMKSYATAHHFITKEPMGPSNEGTKVPSSSLLLEL